MENSQDQDDVSVNLSQMSSFSLDLSQNTLNTILIAGGDRPNYLEEIHIDTTSADNGAEDDDDSADYPTPSSISIQRTIVCPIATTTTIIENNTGGYQQAAQYPSLSHYSVTHHSTTPPPPSRSTPPTGTGIRSPDSLPCAHQQNPSFLQEITRPKLPSNVGFPGQHNFSLSFSDDVKPVPKTAIFTYSSVTKRAYIKKDAAVGIAFSFSSFPPPHSIIRALAIHKAPEVVGEVVQCCPKHIDEQNKKFHKCPRHFVCATSNSEAVYYEEPISGRLSVTHCTGTLQQKSDNTLQAFYTFPCFTSELHKGPGQLVQLIFTLEIGGLVAGRATMDARVCASPGRDRENDEAKLSPVTPNLCSRSSHPLRHEGNRQSRKRSSSTVTQNLECMLPSKIAHHDLCTTKQKYETETFPELFPFIDVCVKMMERVYNVQISNSTANDNNSNSLTQAFSAAAAATVASVSGNQLHTEERGLEEPHEFNEENRFSTKSPDSSKTPRVFVSVESWLNYIGLRQYLSLFESHGVALVSQILGIDNKQLISFGIINNNHRNQLLDGIKLIHIATTPVKQEQDDEDNFFNSLPNCTGPFIPLSQNSSVGNNSNAGIPLEVLRIQMKKTFSSSSNSSCEY